MSEIASASINTFGISPKAENVPRSDEPVFILTSGQLKDLIREAIQPLQAEVMQLRATVDRQEEKIAALESTSSLHEDNQLIQLRLINDLREATKKKAQPLQRDRGEILRALLAANGGKMLEKDARQKMRIDKATFSRLLDTLKDEIDTRPLHQDRRKLLLIIK
jgi:hypothetical protein